MSPSEGGSWFDRFLDESLRLCRRRVRNLERGIIRFLEADKAAEMGNRDKAIEHLEHLMEER